MLGYVRGSVYNLPLKCVLHIRVNVRVRDRVRVYNLPLECFSPLA